MSLVEISRDEYHADETDLGRPALSSSIAHVLCSSSPRHAWTQHPKLNPNYRRAESDRFDVGNVAHAMLLEGTDIAVSLDFGDWRTNAAKQAREDVRATGRIPLLVDQYSEVAAMVAAARKQIAEHHAKPPLLSDGAAERVAVWMDGAVACRAMFDWLREDLTAIDDLKTTSRSAAPSRYAQNLYAHGRDIQAAFYRRAVSRIFDVEPPVFRWIVVETAPPYALSVIEPAADVLALGDAKVLYALEEWERLLDLRGEWPAYPLDVVRAGLPPWEESRWMERMEAVE